MDEQEMLGAVIDTVHEANTEITPPPPVDVVPEPDVQKREREAYTQGWIDRRETGGENPRTFDVMRELRYPFPRERQP